MYTLILISITISTASPLPSYLPLLGLLAGYALLMATVPVRASLVDGLRAVKRYPRLWVILGLFGCGYAVFQLGLRWYFALALPPAEAPVFIWARSAYRPAAEWVAGKADSLWYFPPGGARELAWQAALPALDSLGGLFNNLVPTFPLAAVTGLLLLLNGGEHQAVLWRALRKRFGAAGVFLHAGILLSALAALLKPLLYAAPRWVDPQLWYLWAPVLAWLAFLFEYLCGVALQVYLILLAYCWVRGLSFQHERLVDFAIRRSAFVVRWAGVVLVISTLLIDLPLILKNFAPFSTWLEADAPTLDHRNAIARTILNGLFLAFATVQITLIFHNESLRRSLGDNARFVRRHYWPLSWFIITAGLHFFALHYLNAICLSSFGEGTALWVAWKLLFPWLAGMVGAWLLAAWVSLFHRADSGRVMDKEWVRF